MSGRRAKNENAGAGEGQATSPETTLAPLFLATPHRCTEGVDLPFKATALLTEQGRTRLEITVKIKATFSGESMGGA